MVPRICFASPGLLQRRRDVKCAGGEHPMAGRPRGNIIRDHEYFRPPDLSLSFPCRHRHFVRPRQCRLRPAGQTAGTYPADFACVMGRCIRTVEAGAEFFRARALMHSARLAMLENAACISSRPAKATPNSSSRHIASSNASKESSPSLPPINGSFSEILSGSAMPR